MVDDGKGLIGDLDEKAPPAEKKTEDKETDALSILVILLMSQPSITEDEEGYISLVTSSEMSHTEKVETLQRLLDTIELREQRKNIPESYSTPKNFILEHPFLTLLTVYLFIAFFDRLFPGSDILAEPAFSL